MVKFRPSADKVLAWKNKNMNNKFKHINQTCPETELISITYLNLNTNSCSISFVQRSWTHWYNLPVSFYSSWGPQPRRELPVLLIKEIAALIKHITNITHLVHVYIPVGQSYLILWFLIASNLNLYTWICKVWMSGELMITLLIYVICTYI